MAKGQLRVRITGDDSDLSRKLKSAGGTISKFAVAGAAAVGAASVFSVKKFADFDQAMAESIAIMGDVSDTMRKDMSDAAREVAKTTKFSAEEAAESYFFLASAGLDAEASIAALPRVAAFAQAGNFDMARATDLLTDSQAALGLVTGDTTKDLEQMNRVGDVLVKANTMANASVEQFATSLTSKGANALQMVNKELEEGVAVLAVYADQGIKGEQAGTLLSNMLLGLTETARTNSDAYDKLGVSVFDSSGEMRNMADITQDLEGALGGMTTEQQLAALSSLGLTKQAREGTLALLGNSEAIREYEDSVHSAGDTMDEVAAKQLETFWAQLGLLKDQFIGVALSVGEFLMPMLMGLVVAVQDNMPAIEGFIENGLVWLEDVITNKAVPAIGFLVGVFQVVAPVVSGVFRTVVSIVRWAVLALTDGWDGFASEYSVTTDGWLAVVARAGEIARVVFDGIRSFVEDRLIPAFHAIRGWWQENGPTIREWISEFGGTVVTIGGNVRRAFDRVREFVEDKLLPAFQTILGWWTDHGPPLNEWATSYGETIVSVAEDIHEWINDTAVPALQEMRDWWDENAAPIVESIGEVRDAIAEFVTVTGAQLRVGIVWFRLTRLEAEENAKRMAVAWAVLDRVTDVAWTSISLIVSTVLNTIGAKIRLDLRLIGGFWDRWGETLMNTASRQWEGIKNVISGIMDILIGLNHAFGGAFLGDWTRSWEGIRRVASGIWSAIAGIIRSALALVEGFMEASMIALGLEWDGGWERISRSATDLWNSITLKAVAWFIDVKDAFDTGVGNVREAWENIRGILGWVEDNVLTPIETAVGTFFERIQTAFSTGVEGIRKAWQRLENAAKKPVNFVIGTVYNDGIRKLWNTIAGKIGLSQLPEIARLNRGGPVPGPSGVNRDVVPTLLTPEEFVVNRRSSRVIGPAVLNWLNSIRSERDLARGPLRTGGDLSSVQELNAGGYAKSPDEVIKYMRSKQGPYSFGGWVFPTDCSGWLAAASNYAATGNASAGGRWTTAMAPGRTRLGRFTRGRGDPSEGFSIGVARGVGGPSGGHTRGTIAGVNIESGGGHRSSRIGGPARGVPYGQHAFHLKDYGGFSARERESLTEAWRAMTSAVPGVLGPFGDLFGGGAQTFARRAVSNIVDRLPTIFRVAAKRIFGLEDGGTTLTRGPVLVGEDGPELANLPAGASVTPQNDLVRLLEEQTKMLERVVDRPHEIHVHDESGNPVETARATKLALR